MTGCLLALISCDTNRTFLSCGIAQMVRWSNFMTEIQLFLSSAVERIQNTTSFDWSEGFLHVLHHHILSLDILSQASWRPWKPPGCSYMLHAFPCPWGATSLGACGYFGCFCFGGRSLCSSIHRWGNLDDLRQSGILSDRVRLYCGLIDMSWHFHFFGLIFRLSLNEESFEQE